MDEKRFGEAYEGYLLLSRLGQFIELHWVEWRQILCRDKSFKGSFDNDTSRRQHGMNMRGRQDKRMRLRPEG